MHFQSMCTSRMFRSSLRIIALLKYFKCIESSKEERIQSVVSKPDCLLACFNAKLNNM